MHLVSVKPVILSSLWKGYFFRIIVVTQTSKSPFQQPCTTLSEPRKPNQPPPPLLPGGQHFFFQNTLPRRHGRPFFRNFLCYASQVSVPIYIESKRNAQSG